MPNHNPKVFVTGCFDMLHSGHIAFLRAASAYGDLHVCIGNDENVFGLKGRYPVVTEAERKYMLEAIKYVHDVRINTGFGIMDFNHEFEEIKPDFFVVNTDGHTPEKEAFCNAAGVKYIVLERIPDQDLPPRSTTSMRTLCNIPFRIDLAGGWIDQPFVSSLHPGSVLTISIEPTMEFNSRSGMASSTRNKAIEIWKTDIPTGNREQLAQMLFYCDNPPGSKIISGSQDSIGIVFPGLNASRYNGEYWPEKIDSWHDEDILTFIEDSLQLVPLHPRPGTYTVINNTRLSEDGAKFLSLAADACLEAILNKNIVAFGKAFRRSFEAQIAMFPNMVDDDIRAIIDKYASQAYGWKLSGAGGGGYLILVTDKPIENAIQIKIRRKANT